MLDVIADIVEDKIPWSIIAVGLLIFLEDVVFGNEMSRTRMHPHGEQGAQQ